MMYLTWENVDEIKFGPKLLLIQRKPDKDNPQSPSNSDSEKFRTYKTPDR